MKKKKDIGCLNLPLRRLSSRPSKMSDNLICVILLSSLDPSLKLCEIGVLSQQLKIWMLKVWDFISAASSSGLIAARQSSRICCSLSWLSWCIKTKTSTAAVARVERSRSQTIKVEYVGYHMSAFYLPVAFYLYPLFVSLHFKITSPNFSYVLVYMFMLMTKIDNACKSIALFCSVHCELVPSAKSTLTLVTGTTFINRTAWSKLLNII